MVIGRMISRLFYWAIMKKMTKKWDLETSNAKMELKIRIYAKNWARQVLLKIFDSGQSQRSTVKVNGQRLTCADVAVWRHLRAYVAVREAKQARGAHGRAWGLARGSTWETLTVRGSAWLRMERVLVRQKLQAMRGGACDVVSSCSWLGFARDWLFCRSMPLLSQLDKQNDDIREL